MSRDITIELERRNEPYRAGETLRGSIHVQIQKRTKVKTLPVVVGWYTHGGGNEDHEEVGQVDVFSGELAPGAYSFPFEVALPNHGPYSYHGHYVNVGWYVEARLDVPWAIDPKADVDFWLVPGADCRIEPTDAHSDKKSSQGYATAILGAVCTLFVLGYIAWVALGEIEWDDGICFAIGAAVIGLPLLYKGVMRYLSTRLVRAPHLHCAPHPLVPGGQVAITLDFVAGMDMHLNSVMVQLKATEYATQGSGTDRTTYSHDTYDEVSPSHGPMQIKKGQKVEFVAQLPMPHDAPYSFEASDNSIKWTAQVSIDIPNWPDWHDTLELECCPGPASTPAPSQPSGVAW